MPLPETFKHSQEGEEEPTSFYSVISGRSKNYNPMVDFLPSESPGKTNVDRSILMALNVYIPGTALIVCFKAGRTGEHLH